MRILIVTMVLTLSSCALSSSPPKVVHSLHGEMLADNPIFKKDAIECAQKSESNVGSTDGVANGSYEIYKFFNGTSSCISAKGWQMVQS